MRTAVSVILIGLFCSTLCAESLVDMVLAKIGVDVITYSEVIQRAQLLQITESVPVDTPIGRSLKKKVLDMLIMEKILVKRALRDRITVSDAEITTRVSFFTERNGTAALLDKYSISADEFRLIVKKMLLSDAVTTDYAETRFPDGDMDEEKIRTTVEKWYDSLRKRHKIITYAIP